MKIKTIELLNGMVERLNPNKSQFIMLQLIDYMDKETNLINDKLDILKAYKAKTLTYTDIPEKHKEFYADFIHWLYSLAYGYTYITSRESLEEILKQY